MEHFLKTTVTIEILIWVIGVLGGLLMGLWKWYDSQVIQKGFTNLESKITDVKLTLEENREVHANNFDRLADKLDESFEKIMLKLEANQEEFHEYRDQTAKNIANFWKEYAPALDKVKNMDVPEKKGRTK